MVTPTIVPALIGGALIGTSASIFWTLSRRVAGISGIASGLLAPKDRDDARWRMAFVLGLLCGGGILLALRPQVFASAERPPLLVIAAGLLVGVGTTLGNGCTSGHGVCGISRFSTRSIVATCTFMVTGILATLVSR